MNKKWLSGNSLPVFVLLSGLWGAALHSATVFAAEGVTDSEIKIGTILSVEGRSRALGQKMLKGMEVAFAETKIDGKKLTLISRDDANNPARTVAATKELIKEDVLALLGNVGKPNSREALSLLAENKIPSLIFLSGTDLIESDKENLQIANFRASYKLETSAVINNAIASGVKPAEVCAYVQNDTHGMSGVLGMRKAFQDNQEAKAILPALDAVLIKDTPNKPLKNNAGPVGTYTRDTFRAREGYDSLKNWEKQSGTACKLVITVGSYDSIAYFIAYAVSKGENWVYSAVSSTGADDLLNTLKRFEVTDRVLMTQVLPALNSNLSIVAEAREALGDDFGYVTMNGYISARLLTHGLEQLVFKKRPITRENLIKEFQNTSFQLWGLHLDFKKDGEKFDFITTNSIVNGEWALADESTWNRWYQ
ncbi:MAG: ABC transporter substrate-binding protein [Thiolinea sp.]